MAPSHEQHRVLDAIAANAHISRTENRPMADGSIEAWCFNHDDVLVKIVTVYRDGLWSERPGFRFLPPRAFVP
jgi:hypothetical protein